MQKILSSVNNSQKSEQAMIITPAVYYYRSLLNYHGEHIGLDPRRIPGNTSVDKFAEALAKAWTEYNNPRLDLN